MIVLNTKNLTELQSEVNDNLQAIGLSTSPGSIARLFLNIINKNIADLYDALTVNHLRAFVTTSDGIALDHIGALLQCDRGVNESDDNYRYRITQQCLVLATSNETAVYLTALTTQGVNDVVLKPYSMGAGSFTVIVITDPTMNADNIIEEVRKRLLDVHGYGIRYNVIAPTLSYIKIKQHLHFKDNVSDSDRQTIKYDVQLALKLYFNNLKVGENIITDKITQIIMNVSDKIIEETNSEFYIDGKKAIYVNQSCRWFERFALSPEVDNVVII